MTHTHAHCGIKTDITWDGYKTHFTETCDPGSVHLVTNVTTTVACVSDHRRAVVHANLAERNLLPEEHWVDTGYADAGFLRPSAETIMSPARSNAAPELAMHPQHEPSAAQDDFAIDWDNKRASARTAQPAHSGTTTTARKDCQSSGCGFLTIAALLAVAQCVFSPRTGSNSICAPRAVRSPEGSAATSGDRRGGKSATRSAQASKDDLAPRKPAACADLDTGLDKTWIRPGRIGKLAAGAVVKLFGEVDVEGGPRRRKSTRTPLP